MPEKQIGVLSESIRRSMVKGREDLATIENGVMPSFLNMYCAYVFLLVVFSGKALITVDGITLVTWVSRVFLV
jgi:hypothetical protein